MMLLHEPAAWASVLLRFDFPGAPAPIDLCLSCAHPYVGDQEASSPADAHTCDGCGRRVRPAA